MPVYETGGERSLTKNWCPDIDEHFRNVLLHSSTITVPCARYQLTSGICEIILAIIATATTNYHNYQDHSQLSQLLEIEAIPQIAKALILATLEPLEMRPGSELQYRHNKHANCKVQSSILFELLFMVLKRPWFLFWIIVQIHKSMVPHRWQKDYLIISFSTSCIPQLSEKC